MTTDALAVALAAFSDGGGRIAFARTEWRHRRWKTRGTCGHLIDGSHGRLTPYRYHVWKVVGTRGVEQRVECEDCARAAR